MPAATRTERLTAGVGFVSVLALLLVRNGQLFSTAVYPRGDSAANAILAGQAKHFDLLVGHYSRLGFSHPGPAYLYVQAAGEWLFHDVLRLVPAPWNGQWLALYILNAALVAVTLGILASWCDSWPPVLLCGAATLVYYGTHQNLLSSTWMPYLFIAPFLLLLTSAASVAAGRTRHLWALALAGGLLVHGHVEFLFFVPVIGAAAVVWRIRSAARRDWAWAGAVVAVFLLPMVLNLALHWPGEFPKYFGYGGKRELHGAGPTLRYLFEFWTKNQAVAGVLAVLLSAAVGWLGRLRPDRFLAAGLAMGALATVLFAAYITKGIDDLSQEYVGYFYRAVPLFLLLLAMVGLGVIRPRLVRLFVRLRTLRLPVWLRTIRMPLRVRAMRIGAVPFGRTVTVVALGAALLLAGRSPALATAPENVPDLPRVLGALTATSAGRPLVVDLDQGSWPVLTALIVEGRRAGTRVCARDPAWRFLVTAEFVCTPREVAEGRLVRLRVGPPSEGTVIAELDGTVISAGLST